MEDKYEQRRKRNMRRKIIILVQSVLIVMLTIALIIAIAACNMVSDQLKEEKENNHDVASVSDTESELNSHYDNSSEITESSDVSSTQSSVSTSSETTSKKDPTPPDDTPTSGKETDQWYLKLVNPDISVTSAFIDSVKLGSINKSYVVDKSKESCLYMDARAVDAFNNMCKAAAKEGIKMYSVSSYRTYSYQQSLYNNKVSRVKKANPSLSDKEAKAEAATVVAIPGTSEHHLGLAVDINSVEEDFEETKQFEWLQKHAAEYGFIMRFPKDKQNITKIIYEPWHYRYVGVEHAKAMKENGMCLEEYIEYLKSQGK